MNIIPNGLPYLSFFKKLISITLFNITFSKNCFASLCSLEFSESNDIWEICLLKLNLDNYVCNIISIYRPPKQTNISNFIDNLTIGYTTYGIWILVNSDNNILNDIKIHQCPFYIDSTNSHSNTFNNLNITYILFDYNT